MDRLNLNLLKALTILLEDRNVTRAAGRLHLTQSAMSRQLAALREHFGDPLLIRDGNEYLLSAKARELLPRVQGILADIEALRGEEHFDPASCSRRFSFACTDYVAQFIFPEVLERLQREAPGIDIVYQMWKPEWLDRLGQLPLDFVSTMSLRAPEHLHSIHMGQDSPVCMMAANHPQAKEDRPTLEQLLEFSFVQLNSGGDKDSFFDHALEKTGKQRRIRFEVPFFSAAFRVVAESDSLMVLPAHIARNAANQYALVSRPLPVQVPTHHYYLCWHGVHHQDRAHNWLRQCIADQISQSMYSPQQQDQTR